MSLTGRPLSPPLALTSSSQIFIASSDILPLAASGPVSAMPKPIVMGSAACAGAGASKPAAIAVMKEMATHRRFNFSRMVFLLRRGPSSRFLPTIARREKRAQFPRPARLQRHGRAHEVALAEIDAAMAQDVVGGGAMEKEVRQRVGEQQRLAGELARRSARERDLDLLVLGAVDLR